MTEPWITEPGVYDIPAEQYHADPVVGGSLSNTGAKKLVLPSCPALFKAWRDGLADHAEHFDFGRAAHREVLGVGEPLVVIAADDWKTKAAQTRRDEAYEAGHTPVLTKQYEQVKAMAEKLREHPIASSLLNPLSGHAERTLVWRDEESGVMCRALVDWLRFPATGQQLVVPDYKTAAKVDPESIARALFDFGYYGQAGWYSEGAEVLGLSAGAPAFVLIVQMKTAPYLVVCAQVHPDSIGWGHARNRYARDVYRRCTATDTWPGYADDHVISVQLPTFATYQLEGALRRGELYPERHPA